MTSQDALLIERPDDSDQKSELLRPNKKGPGNKTRS